MSFRVGLGLSSVDLAILAVAVLAAVVGATIAARAGLYFEQIANFVEGIFWITAAAILLRRACLRNGGRWGSRTRHRRLAIGAAITLVAFGISDFIEMRTGAWYDPPALFALKAACVVSLGVHLALFLRARTRDRPSQAEAG